MNAGFLEAEVVAEGERATGLESDLWKVLGDDVTAPWTGILMPGGIGPGLREPHESSSPDSFLSWHCHLQLDDLLDDELVVQLPPHAKPEHPGLAIRLEPDVAFLGF